MALKIGIVTEYYYPLLAGITENVHNTRVRLKEMGYEVKIITSNCKGSKYTRFINSDLTDSEVIRIGHGIPAYGNGSFGHITIGRHLNDKMREILKQEEFDLLHLHTPIAPTLPIIAIMEARCPLVGTFHSYFDNSFIYSILKDAIQKKVIDKMKGHIAVSQSCVEALIRYFKLNPRIIPNGVNTNQFNTTIPRIEKFGNDKINLLFLSRFDPRNGLTLMLQAFKIVKSKFPDVRLIVVGDGPLRFYYKLQIPKELKQDIHFEGLARDERSSYYATCDIFCSPIRKASFGITLLEAMASGKPIVATENTGYRDLVSSDVGLLVPQDDPVEFANSILSLINSDHTRKEMGDNGRKKSLSYSWDNIVCEIASYYEEILQK